MKYIGWECFDGVIAKVGGDGLQATNVCLFKLCEHELEGAVTMAVLSETRD
jgi:hypothetical protein